MILIPELIIRLLLYQIYHMFWVFSPSCSHFYDLITFPRHCEACSYGNVWVLHLLICKLGCAKNKRLKQARLTFKPRRRIDGRRSGARRSSPGGRPTPPWGRWRRRRRSRPRPESGGVSDTYFGLGFHVKHQGVLQDGWMELPGYYHFQPDKSVKKS